MAMVDVAGALAGTGGLLIFVVLVWIAMTKRYSNAQVLLLVVGVLSLLAAIWIGAASAWGQG